MLAAEILVCIEFPIFFDSWEEKDGGRLFSPSNLRAKANDVKRFRGGLVCKAQRLVYHSALGLRVIKKKKI